MSRDKEVRDDLLKFRDQCCRHDWTHCMSDDHRVWTRGAREFDDLLHQRDHLLKKWAENKEAVRSINTTYDFYSMTGWGYNAAETEQRKLDAKRETV